MRTNDKSMSGTDLSNISDEELTKNIALEQLEEFVNNQKYPKKSLLSNYCLNLALTEGVFLG